MCWNVFIIDYLVNKLQLKSISIYSQRTFEWKVFARGIFFFWYHSLIANLFQCISNYAQFGKHLKWLIAIGLCHFWQRLPTYSYPENLILDVFNWTFRCLIVYRNISIIAINHFCLVHYFVSVQNRCVLSWIFVNCSGLFCIKISIANSNVLWHCAFLLGLFASNST